MGESKSNSNRTILVLVHAIMMFLVWLILTPVAVFFVNVNVRRKLFPQDKDSNPKHTGAHSIIMHTAAIIFLIAVLIGIIGIGSRTFIAHFVIGLVVMVMFIIQVILGRLRQLINPTEKPTSSFSVFLKNQKNTIVGIHSWAGRLAWILAVVNIYLGLRIYPCKLLLRCSGFNINSGWKCRCHCLGNIIGNWCAALYCWTSVQVYAKSFRKPVNIPNYQMKNNT